MGTSEHGQPPKMFQRQFSFASALWYVEEVTQNREQRYRFSTLMIWTVCGERFSGQ